MKKFICLRASLHLVGILPKQWIYPIISMYLNNLQTKLSTFKTLQTKLSTFKQSISKEGKSSKRGELLEAVLLVVYASSTRNKKWRIQPCKSCSFEHSKGYCKTATSNTAKNIWKAATLNTAKDTAKTLREQALDSASNMTKDLINGNDMRHSLDRVEIWNRYNVQANSKIYFKIYNLFVLQFCWSDHN